MAQANRGVLSDSCHSCTFSSPFIGKVLWKWWLIKTETAQLGVAGFTGTMGQEGRVFHSTAIAKRHDTVTLQAADGVTILLNGFINRPHTLCNGFSPEVCNQFLLGFPHNWEEFAALSSGEANNKNSAFKISGFSESIKASADGKSISVMPLDHLPARNLRDLLIKNFVDSEGDMLRKSILEEIVHEYSNNAFDAGEGSCLNQNSGSQVATGDFTLDEAPSRKKKVKANQKLADKYNHPLDEKSGNGEFQKAFSEGIPVNSVLGKQMHMSGGNSSISETSCLYGNCSNQVTNRGSSLDETPNKQTAAANLRKEDENHVPDAQSRKEVFQKSNRKSEAEIDKNSLSTGPLTRGKASLYKKTTVDQKQEEEIYVHIAEAGQGDARIVNDNLTPGPLTRSKARKISRSRRK